MFINITIEIHFLKKQSITQNQNTLTFSKKNTNTQFQNATTRKK